MYGSKLVNAPGTVVALPHMSLMHSYEEEPMWLGCGKVSKPFRLTVYGARRRRGPTADDTARRALGVRWVSCAVIDVAETTVRTKLVTSIHRISVGFLTFLGASSRNVTRA